MHIFDMQIRYYGTEIHVRRLIINFIQIFIISTATIKYHSMCTTIISVIDYSILMQDSNIILCIIIMFINKHLHIKERDRHF